MSLKTKFAVLVGALALFAAPTAAIAAGADYGPAKDHPAHPEHPTPGPKASLPEKAKAYGVHCRGFSKKHAKGERGTPFSRCVVAAAQAKKEQV